MTTRRVSTTETSEIKCVLVSSTSNNDNEEDPISDSSEDTKLIVHQVNSKGVDTPIAASPAPVPTKGGEDEVIRVSRIRSIGVKQMEALPPRESKARFRGSAKQSRTVEDGHSDADVSDCAPMDIIEKSPYEANLNAEKGVKLFIDMRRLLEESESDEYRTVSPQATKIFGPTNAWCLVKANALIDKSGMVFSQEWVNGNIRGNVIGKIPNDLLLLCLVSQRFVKAGDLLLSGVTRDLEVYKLVKEAVIEWGLEGQYTKVETTRKNFQFATKKRDCYKCAIFVARVYGCYKAFTVKDGLDDSLEAKVKACLSIMEDHLPDPGAEKKRKKSVEPVPAQVVSEEQAVPPTKKKRVVSEESESAVPPPKKKRGRPRKNSSIEPVKSEETHDTASHMSEESEVEVRPPASSRARKSGGSNGKNLSLTKLVAKFEEKYEKMGDMYKEMGETLAQLKSKIDESRSATEEEIRSELLQEVQQSIMKSLGKK